MCSFNVIRIHVTLPLYQELCDSPYTQGLGSRLSRSTSERLHAVNEISAKEQKHLENSEIFHANSEKSQRFQRNSEKKYALFCALTPFKQVTRGACEQQASCCQLSAVCCRPLLSWPYQTCVSWSIITLPLTWCVWKMASRLSSISAYRGWSA